MAIFREFDNRGRDRSAEDRHRHRKLVEESIKKNIMDIISEESIIGQDKNKKIKIPIKGIKEYRFVYGKNNKGTGSGNGSEKRGDVIGSDSEGKAQGQGSGQAGDQAGEDIYETEITIEELINYLFDDLNLPYLDRKKFNEIESEKNFKKVGYKRKGIPAHLAKKRSVVEKLKRKKSYHRDMDEEKVSADNTEEERRFPFIEDDIRYIRMREDIKRESNAVVICVMDTSGSMDTTKKYIARSFYFLLYQFVRLKYLNVEVVFISHSIKAKEVSEDEFFHKGDSGGTFISSGYIKALEVIEKRYNPAVWNVYAFHCSDGDNWAEDNERTIDAAKKLCEKSNLFGYAEITSGNYRPSSTIKSQLAEKVKFKNFSIVNMERKEDIIPALKKVLTVEGGLGE